MGSRESKSTLPLRYPMGRTNHSEGVHGARGGSGEGPRIPEVRP